MKKHHILIWIDEPSFDKPELSTRAGPELVLVSQKTPPMKAGAVK
jgi:hypothetical protein